MILFVLECEDLLLFSHPFLRIHVFLTCCFLFGHKGVGGIEAEAVMLGQVISMVVPKVVGYKITGIMNPIATSTDVVLTITKVKN